MFLSIFNEKQNVQHFSPFFSFFFYFLLALQYKADPYKTASVMENRREESVFFFTHFTYSPYYQMAGLKVKKGYFQIA